MKNLFSNLKPFIAYWCVYASCAFITLVVDGNTATWGIWALVLVCVLNGITGYTEGVKKIKWGIALFSAMLAVCAALSFVPELESRVLIFGNLIFSTAFDYSENTALNVLFAVLSVVLPLVPFFVGAGLRKVLQNKKA